MPAGRREQLTPRLAPAAPPPPGGRYRISRRAGEHRPSSRDVSAPGLLQALHGCERGIDPDNRVGREPGTGTTIPRHAGPPYSGKPKHGVAWDYRERALAPSVPGPNAARQDRTMRS